MSEMTSAQRIRATYSLDKLDHLYRKEFFFQQWTLDRWHKEGLAEDADLAATFGFDEPADDALWSLGWCEPALCPAFQCKVLESSADYEIVVDEAGRTVKQFKPQGYAMPTFLKHAVAGDSDWEEQIAPRLDPQTPQRWANFDKDVARLKASGAKGNFIRANSIGGYMYLRAMVGPEDICYMFVDNPALVHKMMRGWLALADAVIARYQQHFEFDELFLAEDICYNHGLLISPDMVREFLFPYYQQLLANIRSRQQRRLYFQIDTDGHTAEFVDLYSEIGLNMLSPFEVAAGNDLLHYAHKYPNLIISGGIDKRVLAAGPKDIDEYLRKFIPPLARRGGYIPTCDHGVPADVSLANYMHYRKRIAKLDHS